MKKFDSVDSPQADQLPITSDRLSTKRKGFHRDAQEKIFEYR